MVWPLSLLCPVSPRAPQVPSSAGISEGQGVGFCSGFVQREMGLGGLTVVVQLSRQPQAWQERIKTGTSRRR